MAKRPRPTPGHHGGLGFDPLSYSPHPESDPTPPSEERDSMGKAIASILFGLGIWAVTRLMGDDPHEGREEDEFD